MSAEDEQPKRSGKHVYQVEPMGKLKELIPPGHHLMCDFQTNEVFMHQDQPVIETKFGDD